MPISIHIPDGDINLLDQKARFALTSATEEFIDIVLDESSKLEAGSRKRVQRRPRITATMIRTALLLYKGRSINSKKTTGQIALRVINPISAVILGGILDTSKLTDIVYLSIVVVLFLIVMTTTFLLIISE